VTVDEAVLNMEVGLGVYMMGLNGRKRFLTSGTIYWQRQK